MRNFRSDEPGCLKVMIYWWLTLDWRVANKSCLCFLLFALISTPGAIEFKVYGKLILLMPFLLINFSHLQIMDIVEILGGKIAQLKSRSMCPSHLCTCLLCYLASVTFKTVALSKILML